MERSIWKSLRQGALPLVMGGHWAAALSPTVQLNLGWFWLDGVLANASDSTVLAYLPLFALALGASRAQIGLMDAFSNLSAALVLLSGAAIVERWGHRKRICLVSGGGVARLALLAAAMVPLAFHGPLAVHALITLAVLRVALANVALPAWVSLTADIVPVAWRGRFFAARNMAMGIVGMVVTYLVGLLITFTGGLAGYQLAMSLAFAVGMASTWAFAHIQEPATTADAQTIEPAPRMPMRRHLRDHPGFLAFCAVGALWNFSLNISGPFFNVYIVEILGASAGVIGALGVVSSLAALPGQRLFGVWADRWGPRRVLAFTGLLIPLIPWGLMLARSPWHAAPINALGGFLWAGFNLANFNFLLVLTPPDRRPRYTALYQIVVTVALSLGAMLGGVVASRWGYQPIFIASGVGRLLATVLLLLLIHKPRPTNELTKVG